MADMTELMQYKMLEDDNKGGGWGAGAFLWIILIFLFFLAFSGNGLFGRRGDGTMVVTHDLSQVERDVLTSSCGTQKEILQNRYENQLAFSALGTQMQNCCCDLKTTIIEQNQITRDLIQSQYIDELRTSLSDAKTALSNYNQNQYILGQLGQWYSHPSVNPNTCYNNCNGCGCNNGCGCG